MYDIFTLIELVESKPCLWDKTIDVYKNRTMRNNAWREICLFLEPEFETFDDKKKNQILNTITNKWNNTRDYFIKSLKTKSGQAQKKQYIYHKHLLFLLKIIKEDTTISNIENPSQDNDNDSRPGTSASQYPSQDSDNEPRPGTSTSLYSSQDSDNESRPGTSATSEPGSSHSSVSRIIPTTPLTQHRKKRLNPVDMEILKMLQSHEPRQDELNDDDDKAFLMSILPTIKRIREDDRLEFRIDVMQLLRKYTNRIRAFSFNSVPSSPLPPAYASVNSPTNEATPSQSHLPETQNLMTTPSINSSSAPSTSLPPPHASLPLPTLTQTENQMTAPPISPALSVPSLTLTELLQQDFGDY